jgi:dynein cytoplasmic 1 heavy chain
VNLTIWVEELNSTIEGVLLERLKEAIGVWTVEFNSEGKTADRYGHKSRNAGYNTVVDETVTKSKPLGMDAILHELTIRNQVIFLEPPLEQARSICLSSLHQWLGIVFWC